MVGTVSRGPGRLGGHAELLGAALAQWDTRDDSQPHPEARRAANTAVDAIDAMLGMLHQARQQLVSEVRASDDASAARVDAPLAAAEKPDPEPDPPPRPGPDLADDDQDDDRDLPWWQR